MEGVIHKTGQKGSSTGLNVYAQLAEPSKKDGIWIKTEQVDFNEYIHTQLANIPYDFYDGSAVLVGTDVYLFGGYASDCQKYAY